MAYSKVFIFLRKMLLAILFAHFLIAIPSHIYSSLDAERSVVKVQGKKFGSGFLFYISKDQGNIAYVITASHVVSDYDLNNEFKVTFNFSHVTYIGKVKYIYPEVDLAILALNSYPKNTRHLRFGDINAITKGMNAYILGYPGGGGISRDNGSVRSLSGNKVYLDDIAPAYGNSGGPLLNAHTNKVIGMVVQKSLVPHKQYAISQIKTFVEKNVIFRKMIKSEPEPESIKYISHPLRSKGNIILKENKARKTIFKHNFYESKINPAGQGIANQYKCYVVIQGALPQITVTDVSEERSKKIGMKEPYGALVSEVEPNTFTDYNGFERGDIVIECDSNQVYHSSHFVRLIRRSKPGQTINSKILRKGKLINMDVKVDSVEYKVVLDYSTGLMWQQNASEESWKYVSHENALHFISYLNYTHYAGYSDWRLPTLEEALSIMEPQILQQHSRQHLDPIFDGADRIWTSDFWRDYKYSKWSVEYDNGVISSSSSLAYVRAVRGR